MQQIVRAIQKELVHYPGVDHELANGGRHNRIIFRRGEQSRFLAVPKSPSDWRATNNALRDFKKTMKELGAARLDILPNQGRKGRRKNDAVARLSLSEKSIALSIPAASKLISRFKTPDNRPAAQWRFELRASPDLEAPPMLAAIPCEPAAGKKVAHGIVAGFHVPNTGGWRVVAARSSVKALTKAIKQIPATDIELYENNGRELVFKLPTGLLPTTFKPHPPAERPIPISPEPAPEPAPTGGPGGIEPEQAPRLGEHPMVLQMPKPTVSVEQAIGILNKAKRRLGPNLRFQIVEDGYLTAVHRIGH
jgi:hypothetical protein